MISDAMSSYIAWHDFGIRLTFCDFISQISLGNVNTSHTFGNWSGTTEGVFPLKKWCSTSVKAKIVV